MRGRVKTGSRATCRRRRQRHCASCKRKHKFECTDKLRDAFASTKALGTSWILSALFDPSKETIIQTDSSAHAMGWVLLQYDDNIKARRVVAMGSRAWPEAVRHMPAHELESAALMFEIQRRSSELMQTPLHLKMDSEVSAEILSTTIVSQLPAKYQRWRSVLNNFESVKVHYGMVPYAGYKRRDGGASCRARESGT